MKKIAIIGGGVLAVLGVVVFIALPGGPPWTKGYLERIKGQDAYYREDQRSESIGPLQIRLATGEEEWFMVLEFSFVYSPCLNFEDHAPAIEARRGRLHHELVLFLGDKSNEDLDGPTKLYRLKRELRHLIEGALYPEKEARIDRLHFHTLLLQRH